MKISDSFKLKTNLKNREILTKNFPIFGIFCHKVQHIFGLHYLLINNYILVQQERTAILVYCNSNPMELLNKTTNKNTNE